MTSLDDVGLLGFDTFDLGTVFVRRPHDHGPAQTTDLAPAERWDAVVHSVIEAADALAAEPLRKPS